MHTPSQEIKGDIEFSKVITAKQMPGKVWNLNNLGN
jgi:hypothetical protein